jgi:hypothetical protein
MIDTKAMEAIDDGYTLDGFIQGQEGVFGDLNFRYRPVTPIAERRLAVKVSEVVNNSKIADDEKEVQIELLKVDMVLDHILSWDLKDREGASVDKGLGAVMVHFPGIRYSRLLQIVRDGFASDRKPNQDTPQTQEELEKNSQTA